MNSIVSKNSVSGSVVLRLNSSRVSGSFMNVYFLQYL